jgi:DNA-binding CsgD family transcriptional regulator
VVRLGRADLVADRLEALAARPAATWWDRVCADHARAAGDAEATSLVNVADRFEAGGLDLHAAEAFAQALPLLDPVKDRIEVATSRARLAELLGRCGPVRTPALAVPVPLLTPRELEVARMAAGGFSNPEIAERLGSSPRTVGNQLQHAYDKLGIHDRSGLQELFAGWSVTEARESN